MHLLFVSSTFEQCFVQMYSCCDIYILVDQYFCVLCLALDSRLTTLDLQEGFLKYIKKSHKIKFIPEAPVKTIQITLTNTRSEKVGVLQTTYLFKEGTSHGLFNESRIIMKASLLRSISTPTSPQLYNEICDKRDKTVYVQISLKALAIFFMETPHLRS